jgi:hypothetical protein
VIKGASQIETHKVNPNLSVERDRFGRPLIQTPDGTITPYTRSSTLGKALSDETGLTRWKQRMTAVGIAARKDLVLAVNAHRKDKNKITELVEQAMEVAESSAGATTGTALHELCDQYDQGQTPYVPAEFKPDVQAYLAATELLEVVVSECFCVCDELCVGGSPDRIYRLKAPLVAAEKELLPTGALLVGDIKTGSSLDFGHIGFSVQMAVYARSQRYDLSGGHTAEYRGRHIPVGQRSDWVPGEEVSRDWGLIVHVPSGEGRASLHPVDLKAGWELAQLAATVREWRKRRDLIRPSVELEAAEDFAALCVAAVSVEELMALYRRAVAAGAWDATLKTVFGLRKRALTEAVSA